MKNKNNVDDELNSVLDKKTIKRDKIRNRVFKRDYKEIPSEIENARRQRDVTIEKMSYEAEYNRARSVTIGTAFGGSTEIMMRKFDGSTVWATLQPVEVMEIIHQLSASIGCHINIAPRQDFGSWRDWKLSPEELLHYKGAQFGLADGFPPMGHNVNPHMQVGANMLELHQQNKLPGKAPITKTDVSEVTKGSEWNQRIHEFYREDVEKITEMKKRGDEIKKQQEEHKENKDETLAT